MQTIVTSPPYWGLRSYLPAGHEDKAMEIGSEPTLREFLDTMVGVFDLCRFPLVLGEDRRVVVLDDRRVALAAILDTHLADVRPVLENRAHA